LQSATNRLVKRYFNSRRIVNNNRHSNNRHQHNKIASVLPTTTTTPPPSTTTTRNVFFRMTDRDNDSFLANRSVRARRGTKMAQLIQEQEQEQQQQQQQQKQPDDDAFWSQAFFADAADDAHYSTESESADVVDDDFFDDDDESSSEPAAAEREQPQQQKKSSAYVDPRSKKRLKSTPAAADAPLLGPVDYSTFPVDWQSRLAELETLTVRQLRALASLHGVDGSGTRVPLTRALQHRYADYLRDGASLPAPPPPPAASITNTTTTTTTSLRGSTKERTEAMRAEMLVRESERAARAPRRRRQDAHAASAAPPLTQEERLKEAEETERRNQAELARLTALHDAMRLQRAASARRKRHIVGPIVRTVASNTTTTISFTHPNIDPILFDRPPQPPPVQAPKLAPRSVASYQQMRRLELAQHAADTQLKLDALQRLLAASRERAQQQARQPLPSNLAVPFKVVV
jgi:hypothetical protein